MRGGYGNTQIIDPWSKEKYSQIFSRYDPEYGIAWCYMRSDSRPCFTPNLLAEMRHWQSIFRQQALIDYDNGNDNGLRYQVLASHMPKIFNLGGDLSLFMELINQNDAEGLFQYAKSCIDMLYPTVVSYNLPVTTISLIQGEALGGGFEAALSGNIIIAEKSSRMGLPEILFNLFPGMGAYTLLSHRLGPAMAERIILGGRIYGAEEMYQMGVVDILADDGDGEQAVYEYIQKRSRANEAYLAVQQIRQRYHSVSYEELIEIGRIWSQTALKTGQKDRRMMDRLVKSQNRLI